MKKEISYHTACIQKNQCPICKAPVAWEEFDSIGFDILLPFSNIMVCVENKDNRAPEFGILLILLPNSSS